jgi:hypothetical protein
MPNPKEAKPNDSELEYLPVECPRCGSKGRLRIERLDRSFTCKGCKRVFHVGISGILPGERPADQVDESGALDQFTIRAAPPGLIERLWAKLPKDGKALMGGAIFIGLLVLCNVAYFWFFSGGGVPEKLLDRAKFVGEAYARNNLEDLQEMVAPDTQKEAIRWLAETRPEAWNNIPEDAVVSVSTPAKPDVASAKYGMATVTVKIVVSSAPGYLSVPLYWVPQSKNVTSPDWRLDAKRTFETAGKRRFTLTIPPPRKKSKFEENQD